MPDSLTGDSSGFLHRGQLYLIGASVSPSMVLFRPAGGTGAGWYFIGTSSSATDFPARKGDWQLGHVCRLPIAPSGMVYLCRHAGQVMLANMDGTPKSLDGSARGPR